MAAQQLRAAFPHLSGQQVDDALRRCSGDPDRAVELLLGASQSPSQGSAPPPAAPPDIRRQPEAWFRFFDTNGNGLEKREVVDAVVRTFPGADAGSVRELIGNLWPLFDTDGSGTISLREFTKPDGLRDTLLAQLGGGAGGGGGGGGGGRTSHGGGGGGGRAPNTGGGGGGGGASGAYVPGRPVAHSAPGGAGGSGASSAEERLRSMFPQAQASRIKEALARCRGDISAAAERLMNPQNQQQPQHQQKPPVVQAVPMGVPMGMPMGQPIPMGMPMGQPMGVPMGQPVGQMGGHVSPSGRRRAVLIGINYFGTQAQLRGCINDVNNMQRLLVESFGWQPNCMRILRDDNQQAMPTRANIEASMRWLTEGARPGDVLLFHFSGHGAQQEDPHGFEEDGMNETILPVDFKRAGMISDDHMGELMVRHLPSGVRLTAIMDCCHSGTGLDLPFTWMGRGWREETNPFHTQGDVQMFSGCEDDDTSSDASMAYGAAGGAMTTAFCDCLRQNPCPTYPELIANLNRLLRMRGFSQRAQLTSSQSFDFDRPFLLDDILPNRNPAIGRIFRRKFPPRPRRMDGPLGDMLGIGAAVVGGMIMGDIIGDIAGSLFGFG